MANKILLFVSPAQAIAAYWQGGTMVRCEALPLDDEGLARFSGMLKIADGAPAYVVADSVEEDYRFETLPHATGSDRTSLIDRKIRHYYRSTRFVSAQFRERVGDKRRDDRYLFSALTNPALIERWLATIAEHGSPVAGVFLAPTLTGMLLIKLKLAMSRVLVATPHKAGLRLTFYKDGAFCSSRLTRVLPQDADDALHMLVDELTNTRMYLSTLQLDTLDEPLRVVFFDRDDRLARIVSRVASEGVGLECSCVDRATLLRQLQVKPQRLDLALETIYLHAVAEKAPAANLAPSTVTAKLQVLQRKRSIYAMSAAVGLVGLTWTGYNLWNSHDLAQQTLDAASRTAAAQVQYKEITRTFPAAPTTSENLIQAVNIYQQVVKSIRSPQPFMHLVARAIELSPDIFVQEINWNYGAERPDAGAAQPAPGAATSPAEPGAESARQSGVLSGEVRPFQGDYRAAIESIHRVAERLAKNPAVAEVKVVKLPLNVNPELTLTGDTRDATAHAGSAEFKIMFVLKPNV